MIKMLGVYGVVVVLFLSFSGSSGYFFDDLMEEQSDDTALVESTIREARAVRPQSIHDLLKPGVKEAYIHTYGDEPGADGNVQGFLKKTNDKGDDGYKHFDSYHKKDADKYGFEVHSEYGKLNKADIDTASGRKEATSNKDKADETKKAYKVVEDPESNSQYYGDYEGEGESEKYADSESNSEAEEEEESSPYSSLYTNSDAESDGDDGEKSSYTSSADDGDEESESYINDDEEE
ncbi:uncharacterized protein [Diabrotica undecimpunctata]|uniref:uncharacterized protein n=1 Tax=Diabrotica undecimpunctata TaxID=50387 RepID=UPI003B636B6F